MPLSTDPTRSKPIALWQDVPYLENLSLEIVQALADVATRRQYAMGTVIFTESEPGAGLFMIETGTVKVCRYSKEGREQTLNLFARGDTFNDVSALDGGPNPASAIALTDAVLWRVARTDLQLLARRYPELAWALIESIARRTRYLVGLVQDLSLRSVKSRLAKLLLDQAQNSESDAIPRMLTQEEMASRLGTVREVVGRALRALSAAGIIQFERHQIVILDVARLAEEAEL
ncbi:MAG: Crp/Fnr family transcriptional regulator [Caldilineaceae bacterium]